MAKTPTQPSTETPSPPSQLAGNDTIKLLDPNEAMTRDDLIDIFRNQQTVEPPAYKPPPLTERQRRGIEEEMEAGRRRVAFNEEQRIHNPPPPLDPKIEGSTTPLMMSTDYQHEKNTRK